MAKELWPAVAADLHKLNELARSVLTAHTPGCRAAAYALGDTRCRCARRTITPR